MHLRRYDWIIAFSTLVVVVLGVVQFVRDPGVRRGGKMVYYEARAMVRPASAGRWTVKLDVPYHRQEHALSCEVAALKMVLDFHGGPVAESELIARLPFDGTGPRGIGNVWGDPDVGFVGNIDGKIPNGGYGVYEGPIATLAADYRSARALRGATLQQVLTEVLQGHPVIVWGSLSSGRDISWKTPEGKYVKAVYGEHTRVLIGFSGTPEEPTALLLHDPVYGTITIKTEKFLANWALLGNRAVVVY